MSRPMTTKHTSINVPFWERAFAVIAITLSTTAILPLWRRLSDPAVDPSGVDPVTQAVFGVIYAVVFLLLLRKKTGPLSLPKIADIMLLVILAVCSLAWTDSFEWAVKRVVALIGTTGLGLYLGWRYERGQLFRLILTSLGLVAVLSLLAVLLMPSYGVQDGTHAGAWRGVFIHKNILGRYMAISAVMWWIYVTDRNPSRFTGMVFTILSMMLMAASTSKAGLVVMLVLFAILPFRGMMGRPVGYRVPAVLFLILLATGSLYALLANPDSVLDALGRDITLTGRTKLWGIVWETITLKPWLGYGYGSYWRGADGPSGIVWIVVGWAPPHAHNGYLDVWAQLGVVGFSLLMMSLLSNVTRALRLARQVGSGESVLPFLFLVALVIINLIESQWMVYNSALWVLYVAMSVQLALFSDETHVTVPQQALPQPQGS